MQKLPRRRPSRTITLPTAAPRHGATNSVQLRPRGSQHDADLGAAVAEALFGAPRRHRPVGRLNPQGESMEPVVGSVLHFVPAVPGWVANLTTDDAAWQEPIVGWGCVVVWTAWSPENEDLETKGTKQFQTEVQAITLLEDGTIEPLVMREDVTLAGLVMPGMVLVPSRTSDA